MNNHRPDSWIGRDRKCGCVVWICADIPDMADEVAKAIKSGLDVTKVRRGPELDAVFDEPTFLDCPHGQLSFVTETEEAT